MARVCVDGIKARKLVRRFGIGLLSKRSGLLRGNRAHSGLPNLVLKVNVKATRRLRQTWVCRPASRLRSPCAIQLRVHGSQAAPGTSWKPDHLCYP